jgi:hypothetical protein
MARLRCKKWDVKTHHRFVASIYACTNGERCCMDADRFAKTLSDSLVASLAAYHLWNPQMLKEDLPDSLQKIYKL